ncbi:MAG TPA: SRPBCC domain-containing protein [Ktedonobacterales bacterium]|nr:SRPBCC domain-containing protein [Ktedonobacterales bacterium]
MSETIHLELPIATAPPQIFQALTRADELAHWFAEHADISQAEGRYDFWGALTPEAPAREQGRHRLLSWEADRTLAFTWPLHGAATTATITLEPLEQATRLRITHEGVPARQRGQASMTDFWELSLENLRGWVERRVVGARCDFSGKMYGDVQLAVEINAPRAAVFHALMTPEELDRFFATKALVEPHVGGRYSFGWEGGGPVKILEFAPEAKLAYSWFYENEPPTVVTWTLENSGGGTKLTLVHSGFGEETWTEEYACGWLNCMNRLKFLVEVGPAWQPPRLTMHDRSAV